MAGSEAMQVDAFALSTIEVIMKTGFLKRHETAEPDGLSPFLRKGDGEMVTS